MRLAKELAIVLSFFVLYTPISVSLWYLTGGNILVLLIVLLFGKASVVALLFALFFPRNRAYRKPLVPIAKTNIRLKSVPEIRQDKFQEACDNLSGFRNIFSMEVGA